VAKGRLSGDEGDNSAIGVHMADGSCVECCRLLVSERRAPGIMVAGSVAASASMRCSAAAADNGVEVDVVFQSVGLG
jgi:hypothetical protein